MLFNFRSRKAGMHPREQTTRTMFPRFPFHRFSLSSISHWFRGGRSETYPPAATQTTSTDLSDNDSGFDRRMTPTLREQYMESSPTRGLNQEETSFPGDTISREEDPTHTSYSANETRPGFILTPLGIYIEGLVPDHNNEVRIPIIRGPSEDMHVTTARNYSPPVGTNYDDEFQYDSTPSMESSDDHVNLATMSQRADHGFKAGGHQYKNPGTHSTFVTSNTADSNSPSRRRLQAYEYGGEEDDESNWENDSRNWTNEGDAKTEGDWETEEYDWETMTESTRTHVADRQSKGKGREIVSEESDEETWSIKRASPSPPGSPSSPGMIDRPRFSRSFLNTSLARQDPEIGPPPTYSLPTPPRPGRSGDQHDIEALRKTLDAMSVESLDALYQSAMSNRSAIGPPPASLPPPPPPGSRTSDRVPDTFRTYAGIKRSSVGDRSAASTGPSVNDPSLRLSTLRGMSVDIPYPAQRNIAAGMGPPMIDNRTKTTSSSGGYESSGRGESSRKLRSEPKHYTTATAMNYMTPGTLGSAASTSTGGIDKNKRHPHARDGSSPAPPIRPFRYTNGLPVNHIIMGDNAKRNQEREEAMRSLFVIIEAQKLEEKRLSGGGPYTRDK